MSVRDLVGLVAFVVVLVAALACFDGPAYAGTAKTCAPNGWQAAGALTRREGSDMADEKSTRKDAGGKLVNYEIVRDAASGEERLVPTTAIDVLDGDDAYTFLAALPPPPKSKPTTDDLISALLEAGRQEIRGLPQFKPFRSIGTPLTDENARALEQITTLIGDLVGTAGNLLERELSPEDEAVIRERVRVAYVRRFGLDPNGEAHARAVLIRLVKVAAKWAGGESDPRVREEIRRRGGTESRFFVQIFTDEALKPLRDSWLTSAAHDVIVKYEVVFPKYAEQLSTDSKQAALREVVCEAVKSVLAINQSKTRLWELFVVLGDGVFAAKTNTVKDWRDNTWSRLRDRVGGEV